MCLRSGVPCLGVLYSKGPIELWGLQNGLIDFLSSDTLKHAG